MAVQHHHGRALGRGAAAVAAAVAAAAATGELCTLANGKYTCALCENTTSPLAGEGYTWIVGGGVGAPPCPGGGDGRWRGGRVLAGGTVRGLNRPFNVGVITVAGADVTITGVTTGGVVIEPPGAPRLTLTDSVVQPGCVAVKAAAPQTTPGEMDARGLTVDGVTFGGGCAGEQVVAALAFVELGGGAVQCRPGQLVVTQQRAPVTPADLAVDGCPLADVGGMLNVFGTRYEVLYNDFAYIPHASGFAHWVLMLMAVNFILAIMLLLCGWAKWDARGKKKLKTT